MKSISLVAALIAATSFLPAHAAQFQLSSGVEYSSGNYGETVATEALVLPFSLKVSFGALSLRASIPYVSVRGPASLAPVFEDSGGSNSGSGSSGSSGEGSGGDDDDAVAASRNIQGIGDATASATWSFSEIASTALYVELSARARLPTGSASKGLGLGATDYVAITEIGWDGKRGGVFASGGRRFLEQLPGSVRVDGWQASAGYWRNIGQRSVFGMQGNWRSGATAVDPDPKSIDAYLTRGLSAVWKMEFSASAGFSDANPDYTIGLGFIWRPTAAR